jgi:hypothetical protein
VSEAASTGPVGELRAVRRGRITISRLHRSGPRPYRLLLVGSRSVVGSGSPSPDDRWFAEHLADRAWLQLRRGVDLDVLWELRPVLAALRRSVVPWRLWRYDAVVLVLTAPAGLRGAGRLLGLSSPVRSAVERLARSSAVLLVALEPAALQRSLGVERLVERAPGDQDAERRAVRALVLPKGASAGADRIAQELVDPALGALGGLPRDEEDEEPRRLRALDELGLREGVAPPELDRLVRSARAAFDVHLAAVNVVERDRVLNVAASGAVRTTRLPRALALCDAALTSRDAVVILDTWADPGLAGNELVRGDPPVRFFAAYPLESLEGHRVGAFCIYDTVPREAEEVDLELLRDFALLAEAAITAPGHAAAGDRG